MISIFVKVNCHIVKANKKNINIHLLILRVILSFQKYNNILIGNKENLFKTSQDKPSIMFWFFMGRNFQDNLATKCVSEEPGDLVL